MKSSENSNIFRKAKSLLLMKTTMLTIDRIHLTMGEAVGSHMPMMMIKLISYPLSLMNSINDFFHHVLNPVKHLMRFRVFHVSWSSHN